MKENTSETLAAMSGTTVESSNISFHKDDFPIERTSHNKALHIVFKCCNKIVTPVLIDCGSRCNMCPFTTVRDFGVNIREIKEKRVKVRAFN